MNPIKSEDELTKEAYKRYPLNHTVDDPYGETGEAESDPYGYDETARRAFIEGGKFIQRQHERELVEAIKDPFDYIEPCEPDCSAERHAYHQGQWDMAHRMADKGLTTNQEGEK